MEDYIGQLFDQIDENDVRITDDDEKICIWNYVGSNKSKFNIIRGYITDIKNRKKLICPSLGSTDEFTVEDKENCFAFMEKYTDEWQWFYAIEGTMVRLFYFENQWYLSTHKKLSAFQSRWSCRLSFGEIFIEYLREIYPHSDNIYTDFLKTLDCKKIYYFILRSNIHNRIICDISSIECGKKIVFFAYRNENHNLILNDEKCSLLSELQKPTKLKNISKENLFNFVENEINPIIHQGIIGFHQEKNLNVKIVNLKYKTLSKIRGNNPNIRLRYLEIRGNENNKSIFTQLYPNFQKVFNNYEHIISKIATFIHFSFMERYIRGKYITLPKEEYIVLRKCFEYSQQNGKITYDDVLQILNFENPLYIYKMIHRFKMKETTESFNYRKNDILFFNNLLHA